MADKSKVLAPGFLQPGDLLCYTPNPDSPFLGEAIRAGEWLNGHENLKYCHAGIVVDPLRDLGYEQNPPATHWTKLSEQVWERIDVYRVEAGIVVDPQVLTDYCNKHLNIDYPYLKYIRYIDAAILSRVGLMHLGTKVESSGTVSDPHWEVCSATAADAIEHAAHDSMIWPMTPEEERPCDLTLGRVFLVPGQA